MKTEIEKVKELISKVSFEMFHTEFTFIVNVDNLYRFKRAGTLIFTHEDDDTIGRLFVQVKYVAPCSKTGVHQEWKGRKWYLSSHMTESEIIWTLYSACRMAVEHEMMEGFKVNGIILNNPHVDYKELLKISNKEVKRES